MKRAIWAAALVFVSASLVSAQNPPAAGGQAGARAAGPALPPIDPPKEWVSPARPKELLEFDMMTWPEVYDAIHHQGKTVALYYTGGTEHRGPQNVNGGHTLMAREAAKDIARKLGNAIVLPVIPYSVNNASNQQTGTLGLTNEIQMAITEQICEQAIATGFTTVVILNDHGGGVPGYGEVAKKLEAKYRSPELAAKKVHVFYADHVYAKAQGDFDKTLESRGLPVSGHAGIPDTSEMMFLGKGKDWVRTDLLKYAVTMGPGYTPAPPTGGRQAGAAAAAAAPTGPRIVASGVSGDGRASTEALGKEAFDNKVNQAVQQIKEWMATLK